MRNNIYIYIYGLTSMLGLAHVSYNMQMGPPVSGIDVVPAPSVLESLCKLFREEYADSCTCEALGEVHILDIECDEVDEEIIVDFASKYNLKWALDDGEDDDMEPMMPGILNPDQDTDNTMMPGILDPDSTQENYIMPQNAEMVSAEEQLETISWKNNVIWPVNYMDGDKDDGKLKADFTGRGVHIFVMDTGYHTEYRTSKFYQYRIRFAEEEDEHWSVNDISGKGPFFDCHGHGTAVATYAGGLFMSAAPNSVIHIVRVSRCSCDTAGCGQSSVMRSDSFRGINWIVDLVKRKNYKRSIIVRSLSTAKPDNPNYDLYNYAANKVDEANILWIASAGNEDTTRCAVEYCKGRDRCPVRSDFDKPLFDELVLIVGSINKDGSRSSFSNWGSCVRMFMYGSHLPSVPPPNVGLAGFQPPAQCFYSSGTSFAAPLASGIAAMILERNGPTRPSITRQLLFEVLRHDNDTFGIDLETVNADGYYGYKSSNAPSILSLLSLLHVLICFIFI